MKGRHWIETAPRIEHSCFLHCFVQSLLVAPEWEEVQRPPVVEESTLAWQLEEKESWLATQVWPEVPKSVDPSSTESTEPSGA